MGAKTNIVWGEFARGLCVCVFGGRGGGGVENPIIF